jgi:hypothetical protein
MSKLDMIFRMQMLICRGDREKAKKRTRDTLKDNLRLASLWFPRRVEHGRRLLAEVE